MAIGLTIVKRGFYRGVQDEEWSNKYHLTGSDPADSTAWRTLFDSLVAQEKTLYQASHQVVRGYGYTSDSDTATAVWSVDLTVAPNTPVSGTLVISSSIPSPGDLAAWIRWKTSRMNSKGKPIYLRKYFHGIPLSYATPDYATADNVPAGWATAATAFGNLLQTTGLTGGQKIRDTGGGSIVGSGHSSYMTTRTLKRRGKRP